MGSYRDGRGFSLPSLRLGSGICPGALRRSSELLNLALRCFSKFICFFRGGLADIFYFGAHCFFDIFGGGS